MQQIQKIRFLFAILLSSLGVLSADPMLWNGGVIPYNVAIPYEQQYDYPQQCYCWSMPYAAANAEYNYPQQSYGCGWSMPYVSNPEVCPRNYTFFVRGDLLYWQPHVARVELDFGNSSIAQTFTGGTQTIFSDEFDSDPHFDWNAGCRLSAGFQSSNFELGIMWTHFQDKASSHSGNFHKGKYHLNFDQIDLLFGYATKMNSNFTLKPFAGIRFAYIRDHIKADLKTDIAFSPTSVVALQHRILNDKQNLWSGGPVAGINGEYIIGEGFGFYGTADVGLLYGDYKVSFNDIDLVSAPLSKQIFSQNKRHLREFNWNVDLALGICWSAWISNLFEVRMKLGFEHHQYFDHGHLSINPGDLTFDGGIYSLEVSF